MIWPDKMRWDFPTNCQGELWNYPEIFKRKVYSDGIKIWLYGYVNQPNRRVWVLNVQMKFMECQTTDSLLWFGARYRTKIIGPCISQNDNVTRGTYKRLLCPYSFPKHRVYLESILLQLEGLLRKFSSLCVSLWTNSTPIILSGEKVPSHGLADYRNWRLLPSSHEDISKIMYTKRILTHFLR